MEQDVARALADMRHQLNQLQSALGAGRPNTAQEMVPHIVQHLDDAHTALVQMGQNQAAAVARLSKLEQWAQARGFSP